MSDLPVLNGMSRREILRAATLILMAGGPMEVAFAQHVHEQAGQDKQKAGGTYQPKQFNDHEYKTITRLAVMIVPADGSNGSALDAGAPEFIDVLCTENEKLAAIYTGGLLWLDRYMLTKHAKDFVSASEAQQTAMLDALVAAEKSSRDDYEGPAPTEDLTPGVTFFDWMRRMTVDAYYTSAVGMKDIGYVGNTALAEYAVPQEAIDYLMNKKTSG